MISSPLPPLDCSAVQPSPGERLLQIAIVVGLHLLLLFAALYLSVKNELIELPPSISVRLLPMLDEKPRQVPVQPPPPKPQPQVLKPPQAHPPVSQPTPVLAVNNAAAAPAFAVAPQPPSPPPQPVAAQPAPPAPLVLARFDADYLHNPKPAYPTLARRRGEEGKVQLKVRVSAQGEALNITLAKSSGYDSLDAAAIEAVTRWRFVPARRGEETVESSVIVPVTFSLE